jgi:hypothetical protein
MQTIEFEYDCGYKIKYPTTMAEDSSILYNATLVDTLTISADAEHDANCEVCND